MATETLSKSRMSRPRLVGLDVARAIALIGMFAAHIGPRYDASGDLSATFTVVAGRSSALFAVLAGVSLVLMSARRLQRDPAAVGVVRAQIASRALLIAALGAFIGALGSGVAVILVNYGVLFLLAIPVITWGWRRLLALWLAWLLVSPTVTWLLAPHLPAPTGRVTSILSLRTPLESASELLLTGYYPVFTWGTYLFFGMALARLGLHRKVVRTSLLAIGLVTAPVTLWFSQVYTGLSTTRERLTADVGMTPQMWPVLDAQLQRGWSGNPMMESWAWMPVWAPHTSTMMDLLHTCATAAAVIGLALVLTAAIPRALAPGWRIAWGAGTMTLTLYVGHVVVLAAPAWVPGNHSFAAHTLGALLIGAIFAAACRRGPLEALLNAAVNAPAKTHQRD